MYKVLVAKSQNQEREAASVYIDGTIPIGIKSTGLGHEKARCSVQVL